VPFFLTPVGYGQTCPATSLNQAIEQLQHAQQRPEAQKALTQCGEAAAKPLATALSDSQPATRLYAAQTLAQMGWQAKSAVPALVAASQEDSDLQVRSSAIWTLTKIAQASQTQSEQWQGWQCDRPSRRLG
jgi:HEAT repeat protein